MWLFHRTYESEKLLINGALYDVPPEVAAYVNGLETRLCAQKQREIMLEGELYSCGTQLEQLNDRYVELLQKFRETKKK